MRYGDQLLSDGKIVKLKGVACLTACSDEGSLWVVGPRSAQTLMTRIRPLIWQPANVESHGVHSRVCCNRADSSVADRKRFQSAR